jgi:hypothetical protein
VDGDVKTKELNECLIVTKAKEGREVGRVVLAVVNGREFSVTEHVAVYTTCDVGELSDAKGEVRVS